MSVHFNPTSRTAAPAAPVESRPPAPAGLGNEQSTIASMAESESSGCCLSELFHCLMRPFVALWNCISGFFFSKEVSAEELRITPVDPLKAKIEKCIKQHCSEINLAQMNASEWKAATIVFSNGVFLFSHCDRMSRETANAFQEKAIERLHVEMENLTSYTFIVKTFRLDENMDKDTLRYGMDYILRCDSNDIKDDGQFDPCSSGKVTGGRHVMLETLTNRMRHMTQEEKEPLLNFFFPD